MCKEQLNGIVFINLYSFNKDSKQEYFPTSKADNMRKLGDKRNKLVESLKNKVSH